MRNHDIEIRIALPVILRRLPFHLTNPSQQLHSKDLELLEVVGHDFILPPQRISLDSRGVFEVVVVVDPRKACHSNFGGSLPHKN